MAEEISLPNIISRQDARASGFAYYFTGRPCKRGHVSERYVKAGDCTTCCRDRVLTWQKCNPEKFRKNLKKYDDSHPEVRARATQNYRAKNLDKIRDCTRKWQEENRDKAREACKSWYYRDIAATHERSRRKVKEWGAKNREKLRVSQHRRRSRLKGVEGEHTADDLRRILDGQNCLCIGCGKDIRKTYTVDHIIPIVRGGTNWPTNIQMLCRSCNSSKGSKTMDEWMLVRKRRLLS